MLKEYVIVQPKHDRPTIEEQAMYGPFPELEWTRSADLESTKWVLSAYRTMYYDTTFELRTVMYPCR